MSNPLLEDFRIPIPPYKSGRPDIRLVSDESNEKKVDNREVVAEIREQFASGVQFIRKSLAEHSLENQEEGKSYLNQIEDLIGKVENIVNGAVAVGQVVRGAIQTGQDLKASIGDILKANGQELPESKPRPEPEVEPEVAVNQPVESQKPRNTPTTPRINQKTERKELTTTEEFASINAALARPENQRNEGLIRTLETNKRILEKKIAEEKKLEEDIKNASSLRDLIDIIRKLKIKIPSKYGRMYPDPNEFFIKKIAEIEENAVKSRNYIKAALDNFSSDDREKNVLRHLTRTFGIQRKVFDLLKEMADKQETKDEDKGLTLEEEFASINVAPALPENQIRAIQGLLKEQERSLAIAIRHKSPDDNIQRIRNNIRILQDALEETTTTNQKGSDFTREPKPEDKKPRQSRDKGTIRDADMPAELRGEMDDLKRRLDGLNTVEVEPVVISPVVTEPAPSVPATPIRSQSEARHSVVEPIQPERERTTNLRDISDQELKDELKRREKGGYVGRMRALWEKIKVNVKGTYESLPQAVTMAFDESFRTRERKNIEMAEIESNLHKKEKKRLEELLTEYEKKKKSPKKDYTPREKDEIAGSIIYLEDQIKKEEAAIMKFNMKRGEQENRRDIWEDRRDRAVTRYVSRIDSVIKDFSDRKVALEEALKTETNPRKKQQIRKSIDRINFAINPWKSKRDTAENAIKKKLNKPNGQK